jgi:hypothetical protein
MSETGCSIVKGICVMKACSVCAIASTVYLQTENISSSEFDLQKHQPCCHGRSRMLVDCANHNQLTYCEPAFSVYEFSIFFLVPTTIVPRQIIDFQVKSERSRTRMYCYANLS